MVNFGLLGALIKETPKMDMAPLEEKIKENKIEIDDSVKGMFQSVEAAGKKSINYLALEKTTFEDLRKRKLVREDIKYQDLQDPNIYDEVAGKYIEDLMTTFKIPSLIETVLWSYRPSYYKRYGGDIEKIPDDKKGSFGKSAKEVMRQRKKWLDIYLKSLK